MKMLVSTISASALIAVTMAATAVPASAAGIGYSNGNAQVQFVARKHHNDDHKKYHFEKRGKWAYLNGHRGDRHRHAGWREYNGYWFPPAAFIIGSFITGAIINGILNHR
jgi:hypothetical protein